LVFDPDFADKGIVPPGQQYDNGLIILDDEDSLSVLPLEALSNASSQLAGSATAPILVPLHSPTPASAATHALIADSLATMSSSEDAVLHEVLSQVVCVHCKEVATMVRDIVEKATAAREWQSAFYTYYQLTLEEMKEHLKITHKEMGAHFL
jgi:hypothetical protein